MRIDSVEFQDFKNLGGVPIEFAGDHDTSVIVGRNGTGKSNLLEGLAIIFRDLDLGRPSDLDYEIRYECRGRIVELRSKSRKPAALVDGEKTGIGEIRAHGSLFRPDFVFGYYSGPSNRFESVFLEHERNFYRALLNAETPPLRSLFFARPHHSQFVLLAFATTNDTTTDEFLTEELRIQGIDSVTFVLQEPPWAGSNKDPHDFWGARGTVRGFLDRLQQRSAPLTPRTETEETRSRAATPVRRAYLHLLSVDKLQELASSYGRQREFFSALESMSLSDLLYEVRVEVVVEGANKPLEFRELSEGEQQLLVVLGLLQFTAQDEALYLLDEPDTHFNPAWSLSFTRHARRFLGDSGRNHLIMATHDPLVIADLTADQVVLLERRGDQLVAGSPEEDPRGQGVAGLLTSDIYGLRSQLDLTTLEVLDRKRRLAAKVELTEQESAELKRLNDELHGLDSASNVRDPAYAVWLEAYNRRSLEEGLDERTLTPEQRETQKALALEILRDVEAPE